MSTAEATSTTVGSSIKNDPQIRAAIDQIVARVVEHNSQITDVRPPTAGLKQSYEDLMKRAAAVKGRPLLYPYLGSGGGNGALVELEDGSVKWDMITGIGVHFFGHGHPELIKASLEGSVESTPKHGNLMSSYAAYGFIEKLVEHASKTSDIREGFATTSGAVANESAIKICYQKHAPASRVLAFKHCFMGRTVTMAQIGDSASGREGIPLTTQVDYMPYWNDDAVEKVGGAKNFIDHACWRLQQFIDRYPGMHACFIFELIQGEGGFNTAPRDYLVALMDMCRANNIAIWDDEVQTFGRTQRMFAYETYDLGEYVDVLCVGKMTQACATLWTERYAPKPGLLSGTFTGTSQDFAVGTRMIEMLAEGDYYDSKPGMLDRGDGRIAQHHAAFRTQFEALKAKHPDWFPDVPFGDPNPGGIGGMCRFTPFGGEKAKVAKAAKACFEEGVVLFWCGHGPFHLRVLPPLGVFKMADWPRVFECIERGLARVAG
ncbi:MAG: aminotransferase class III-fold pyridoxal phosphate-dependent enzyme [Planctomycetota bacterium]